MFYFLFCSYCTHSLYACVPNGNRIFRLVFDIIDSIDISMYGMFNRIIIHTKTRHSIEIFFFVVVVANLNNNKGVVSFSFHFHIFIFFFCYLMFNLLDWKINISSCYINKTKYSKHAHTHTHTLKWI